MGDKKVELNKTSKKPFDDNLMLKTLSKKIFDDNLMLMQKSNENLDKKINKKVEKIIEEIQKNGNLVKEKNVPFDLNEERKKLHNIIDEFKETHISVRNLYNVEIEEVQTLIRKAKGMKMISSIKNTIMFLIICGNLYIFYKLFQGGIIK